MKYYYYKLHNPKYYFPSQYKDYPILLSLYNPYNWIRKGLWKAWIHLPLIKYFFSTPALGNIIPFDIISEHLPKDAIASFHISSLDTGNKITALAILNETPYFFKFSTDLSGKELIRNEVLILKQLKNSEFSPHLLKSFSDKRYELLITDVFKGSRLPNVPLNHEILDLLINLADLKIKSYFKSSLGVRTGFAHGDFCPWNMIRNDQGIKLFDWEKAGNYPLGYDLFHYIFQTSFLVSPYKSIDHLLKVNNVYIDHYFNRFNIKEWKVFLKAFSQTKIILEKNKKNDYLLKYYLKLMKHAEAA